MTFTDLSVDELDDPATLLMNAFFTPSDVSKAAGHACLERLKLRTTDRDKPVSKKAATGQLEAIREWGAIPSENRFAMLGQIRQPTLNGTRMSSCRSTPFSWRSIFLMPN